MNDKDQMDMNEQDAFAFDAADSGADQFEIETNADDDPNVVVIGWQFLLIPLVILTILGGYMLGRFIRGESIFPQNTEVAGVPGGASLEGAGNAAAPDPNVIRLDPSGGQPIPPNPGQGAGLPRSNHFLMDKEAPDFEMTLLDTGETVKLSDYRGKTVMINFWATWCPPCVAEMPFLESVYKRYQDQDFVILAVDGGEKVEPQFVEDTIARFVQRSRLTFPILWGDTTYEVQRDYQVRGLPSSFIVNPEGIVVHQHGGMYPSEYIVDKAVSEVLSSDG